MGDTSQGPHNLAADLEAEEAVYRFILDQMESVPHLEALLLVWNSRPQAWTVENLARRLYIPVDNARALLEDLVRRRLVSVECGPLEGCRYQSSSVQQHQLMAAVDRTYRRELVRISTMIHSKLPASVREFARAFRITRERD